MLEALDSILPRQNGFAILQPTAIASALPSPIFPPRCGTSLRKPSLNGGQRISRSVPTPPFDTDEGFPTPPARRNCRRLNLPLLKQHKVLFLDRCADHSKVVSEIECWILKPSRKILRKGSLIPEASPLSHFTRLSTLGKPDYFRSLDNLGKARAR